MEHCKTCQQHEYIVSVVKKTADTIDDIKDDISTIKISIAERNAFLGGIRTTLKIIAVIMAAVSAMLGYGWTEKILKLFHLVEQ